MLKNPKECLLELDKRHFQFKAKKAFHIISLDYKINCKDDFCFIVLSIGVHLKKKSMFEEILESKFQISDNHLELVDKKINGYSHELGEGIDLSLVPILKKLNWPLKKNEIFSYKKDYEVELNIHEDSIEADIRDQKANFIYDSSGLLDKIHLKLPVLGKMELKRDEKTGC